MSLLTLDDVRILSDQGTRGSVVVEPHQVLTPGARDFLQAHRIAIVCPGSRTGYRVTDHPHGNGTIPENTASRPEGDAKPEYMTHLRGDLLVYKDHPRIAFRGMIDALEAEVLLVQHTAAGEGYRVLTAELEEVLAFVRKQIRCDVLNEPEGEITLCGYDADQLRDCSHHPEQYFGQPHFMPSYTDGATMIAVNRLRTIARQTELSAYRAFRDTEGGVTREDIILALNRLSSLLWIMMIRLKAGKYECEQQD